MNHEIAQLRHMYAQMVNGCVKDSASAKRIAEGLLAPVIEGLERDATLESADTIEAQSKQIEALQADAGRYRWLASQVSKHDADGGHSKYFSFPNIVHVDAHEKIYFKTVDEAIDAVRARLGEGGGA